MTLDERALQLRQFLKGLTGKSWLLTTFQTAGKISLPVKKDMDTRVNLLGEVAISVAMEVTYRKIMPFFVMTLYLYTFSCFCPK